MPPFPEPATLTVARAVFSGQVDRHQYPRQDELMDRHQEGARRRVDRLSECLTQPRLNEVLYKARASIVLLTPYTAGCLVHSHSEHRPYAGIERFSPKVTLKYTFPELQGIHTKAFQRTGHHARQQILRIDFSCLYIVTYDSEDILSKFEAHIINFLYSTHTIFTKG